MYRCNLRTNKNKKRLAFYLVSFLSLLIISKKLMVFNETKEKAHEEKQRNEKALANYYIHVVELKRKIEVLKMAKGLCEERTAEFDSDSLIRDFYRYDCKQVRQYGFDKVRIKGGYYVCEDESFRLMNSECIVLSFGFRHNDEFGNDLNTNMKCTVHTLHPDAIPPRMDRLKQTNNNQFSVEIQEKWKFHRIGLANEDGVRNVNKPGWKDTFENVIQYLKLKSTVLDLLKIDVEGDEWSAIHHQMATNPNLMCQYVKQLILITRPSYEIHRNDYKTIRSLELCFRLYKREPRFHLTNNEESEWQQRDFQLPLKNFKDEIELSKSLFAYGTLYFVNKNFSN